MMDGSRGAASESKVEVDIDFFTVLELRPPKGDTIAAVRSSSPSSLMGGLPKRL